MEEVVHVGGLGVLCTFAVNLKQLFFKNKIK